ncbi:hypothetical protein GCM10010193_17450 [Kitasatospora atroaurantiaca]
MGLYCARRGRFRALCAKRVFCGPVRGVARPPAADVLELPAGRPDRRLGRQSSEFRPPARSYPTPGGTSGTGTGQYGNKAVQVTRRLE